MSGGLARLSGPSGLPAPGGGAADAGVGMDIASVSFTGPALVAFADLPATFPDAPGPAGPPPPGAPMASGVQTLPGATRIGGVAHQVRLGWAVWPDRLIVVRVARTLARRDDGRYSPDGSWALLERTTWRGAGKVSASDVAIDPPGAQARAGKDVPVPAGQVSARLTAATQMACALLPAPTRSWLATMVPAPTLLEGVVGRVGDRRDVIDLVRADAAHAVAVHAERGLAEGSWRMARLALALSAPQVEAAGSVAGGRAVAGARGRRAIGGRA